MIKAAIEKIEELSKIELFQYGDREYTSKPVIPVKNPTPEALNVTSLSAIADYININFDHITSVVDPAGDMTSGIMVYIKEPGRVGVVSCLDGPFMQRHIYLFAKIPDYDAFAFGRYYDVEEFIIKLQSVFIQDDTTAAILKLVGNLRDSTVKTASDDGVTQTVKVKSGITRIEEVAVMNPVTLRPYRTFLEVEQPASRFVIRLRQSGDLPQVALFEADGGWWKIEAMKSIAYWLSEHITADIPILM